MSDIFICYSRKDKVLASRLKQRLQAEGWTVFMDEHIDAGHRWAEEITKQLAAAQAVLILWSKNSIGSRFVLDEAHEAAERKIIFPARIEEVTIPYGFRQFQTPDLIGWDGNTEIEQWQLLVNSLRNHLIPVSVIVNQDASKQSSIDQQYTPSFPAPGQTFRDKLQTGGEGPLMAVIPAGRFLMGSLNFDNNETPEHAVQIAQPFALGVYTVTFDEYDRFCQETGRVKPQDQDWGRGNRSVINVSWHDAQAYCKWLSQLTNHDYRLPSEAEWEYACRAATETPYSTGKTIAKHQANFDGEQTLPVGSYPPNAFGLYDMHGNVWEWIQDCWHANYQNAPNDGSAWLAKHNGDCDRRVVRGGSWILDPQYLRSAYRYKNYSDGSYIGQGFRIARAL